MATISSNFSLIQEYGSWTIQKIAESIKTERLLYAFPVAISVCTAYFSLSHYKTALFGTDSLGHRKTLLKEAYWKKECSLTSRLGLIFRSLFGSIRIEDRSKEFLYGSAYLAVSMSCLYALHAIISESSKKLGRFDSHFDESTKELFPEYHQKNIHDKALDYLSEERSTQDGQSIKLIELFEKILLSPSVPKLSKEAELAVHFADQALLPTPTPFEEYFRRPISSLLHTASFGQYGTASTRYSTEYLTTEELTEVYQKTRQLVVDQEPINWQAHIKNFSKTLCDWTWGFSPAMQEEDCSNFASLFNDSASQMNTKRLDVLDRLYKTLMQRAILQGRGDCSTPQGAEQICEEYIKSYVTSAFGSIKSYFSLMQQRGEEFINQVELSKVFPISTDEKDLPKLESFGKILDSIGKNPESNGGILRTAAAHFFGLKENFSKEEFQKAFRALSKIIHPDKGSLDSHLFQIASTFNNIFGKKAAPSLYGPESLSAISSNFFPSPWNVVYDLGQWTFNWFKQPPPPLRF